MGLKLSAITRHRAGTTFVFIFFLIFLIFSGLLIPRLLKVYDGIVERANTTYNDSAVLEHISGAVRRADCASSIKIKWLADTTPVLSITDTKTEWLYYCRDGYLYKQNSRKSERSAERLCPAGTMRIKQDNNMLLIEYIPSDNSVQTLILTPRCGTSGGV